MNIDKILDAAFAKVCGPEFAPLVAVPEFDADEVKHASKPNRKKRGLIVGSKLWKNRVKFNLVAGYGVEDIAIKLQCNADDVRAEVRYLRWNGQLAKWWNK